MKPWQVAVLLLSLLICGALAYWIHQHSVEETVTVWSPPGVEARRNPLLAAERFLRAMDQRVESVRGSQRLFDLPPRGDTLLLYRNRTPLSEAQVGALFAWVEQGGSLIMDTAQLWDAQRETARSLLLDNLGVGLIDTGEQDATGHDPVDVEFEDAAQPVSVSFEGRYQMVVDDADSVSAALAGDQGYYLLQFERGDGMVTLVNDLAFLDNRRIGKQEHAYFLYLLANTDQTLWLLYDPYSRGLAGLLWSNARETLISLLLVVLFALWAGNWRIGPLLPRPVSARRNHGAHLDAQGRFDLAHGLVSDRLRVLRAQVEHCWLLHHPQLKPLDARQRSEWIAGRVEREPGEIHEALYEDLREPVDLVRQTALLQRLRHWNP